MTDETTPDAVERQYQDSDGNPCDLVTLCLREPEWAASRLAFERARHAEEVAELMRDVADANNARDTWRRKAEHLNHQALSGLSAAGIATPVEGFIEAGGGWLDRAITELANERRKEAMRADEAESSLRDQLRPLEALRSLLPDVRACAEYVIGEFPENHPAALTGSRLLAALDSHECPECHMPGHHKMSCSRGGSKGGRFGVRLDSQGGEGE